MISLRSWLFVSGARPEHFAKAIAAPADAVIFDLEDSVPTSAKAEARQRVVGFLMEQASSRTFVRVNPITSGVGQDDLRIVADLPIGGVRLPKVQGAVEVRMATETLANHKIAIQATIESARGLRALGDIAAEDSVCQLCLGEADLVADLNMASREWLEPIRIDVVVQSRAAGLLGPIQSPHTDIRDLRGLEETTRTARSMGFAGRSAIHPTQLDVINSVYLPDDDEVAHAKEILRALDQGEAEGRAGVQLADGRFVDRSSAGAARRILAARQRQDGTEPSDHHSTKGATT